MSGWTFVISAHRNRSSINKGTRSAGGAICGCIALYEHTHATTTEATRVIYQCLHHHAMCFQQIFHAIRVQCRIEIIGGNSILHFLYLLDGCHYGLSINNVAHLVFV